MGEIKLDEIIQQRFSQLNVLIVDDVELERRVMTSILKKLGIVNFHVAENGSVATGKIENALAIGRPFDMVITDWRMPSQDGDRLLKWIRNKPKLRRLPVIITTGSPEEQDIEHFVNLGASNFIVKPVTLEVVKRKLLQLLHLEDKNVG